MKINFPALHDGLGPEKKGCNLVVACSVTGSEVLG